MNAAVMRVDEQNFSAERVFAVDPSFLEMFHYPLLYGNSEAVLKNPLEVILTRSAAMRYFGKVDVVGESLWVSTTKKPMKVVGVCEDSPANSHFKFDVLYPYSVMKETLAKRTSEWNSNDTFTYFLLNQADQYDTFKASLARLTEKLVAEEKIVNERLISQPIADIHLYSHKSFEVEVNGDAQTVFFLLGVGLLVILIAIVNYINLSTAKSLDRAKEVGIRKVIGSTRGQLRLKFFIESFCINSISGLLAIVTLALISEPFIQVAGLPSDFNLMSIPLFWLCFAAIIFVSSLLGGIFPAYTISTYSPISVLKGKFANSGTGVLLRKGLVIFQFAIATFLLIQTFTSIRQLNFMQSKDLGLTSEQVMVVNAPATWTEMKNYGAFKDQLLSLPSFSSVALSNSMPGFPTSMMGSTTGINLVGSAEQHNYNFYLYFFDEYFIPGMKIELLAGENFREGVKQENDVIVNEESLRLWGISDPQEAIGRKITMNDESKIVGVIRNFHQTGVKSSHIPMVFRHAEGWGSYISIRTTPGEVRAQVETLEELYNASFNSPFEFFFLDQKYDAHFRAEEQFQMVFSTLSMFALLITCLGIFGLASFTVAKRQKEIGIRKVLGASVSHIISLLTREFARLIVIATIVAIPVTYLIIQGWLESYAYHINLEPMLFALPAIIVIGIALVTILSRTFQITKTDPVNVLRNE